MESTKESETAPGDDEEMLPEYDFSKGERGRYAGKTFNYGLMVSIDKDLAAVFDDSEKVNRALRLLVELGELTQLLGTRRDASPVVERRALVLAEERANYDAGTPVEGR